MYKKYIKNYFLGLISLCMVIFFIFIVFSQNYSDDTYNSDLTKNITELSNNWREKINNNATQNTVNFPNTFEYSHGKSYTFSRILDDDFSIEQNTLCVSTGFSNLYVYLDNKLIYDFSDDNYETYSNKGDETILFIKLPDNYQNKELRLETNMRSNSSLSYNIKTPLIGNEISIIYHLLIGQSYNLLLIFLLFTFSFIILITSSIANYKKVTQSHYLFFLGIFSLLSAIYSLSGTNLLILVVNNNYLRNIITFIPLSLIPLSFCIMIYKHTKAKYRKVLNIAVHLLFFNFIIQSLLTYLHIFDFRFMLPASHITILVGIIIVIYTLIRSWNDQTKSSRTFVFCVFPIIIGTLIDIIIYYINTSCYGGIFFQTGVLLFTTIQFFYVINSFWDNYILSVQSNMYKKMAFTDSLTNLNNRAAFEIKIKKIDNNLNSYSSIWCFSIDINNLKYINDNLGHEHGDYLIINCATIIKNTFGDLGFCYRIGGDEFIVLLCNLSHSEIQNLITKFYNMIDQHNSNSGIKISLAIGYDTFDSNQDTTISSLISRSDKLMYKNKIKIKSTYK